MGTIFYLLTGFWALVMIALFIAAIRLSYGIEARSPELVNRTGLPQPARMLHTISNRKVAADEETQRMRRRMNRLLLFNLAGFAVLWSGLQLAGAN